jgi:hypothetical protein
MSSKHPVDQQVLHEPFIALEKFGCFVSLSQDRATIFIRTMLIDGEVEGGDDFHAQTGWVEVTAPHPDFLLKVNELFGTAFREDDFTGR